MSTRKSKAKPFLRTSDIARAVSVHPNTIRTYESWGYLPPIPRYSNGYRRFTEFHLQQAKLIRLALNFTWLGGNTRKIAVQMIRQSASRNSHDAIELGRSIVGIIESEKDSAEKAITILEKWADSALRPIPYDSSQPITGITIGKAAKSLNVTSDALRTWERNGLLEVPQNPRNRYRIYTRLELNRIRVIRTLRAAGYSMMSIYRMLYQLDEGKLRDLKKALNTPGENEYDPDSDAAQVASVISGQVNPLYATDHWLTTLTQLQIKAKEMMAQLHLLAR
jgi:DNA-binding transcriptional MerR regulator